jgi:hypothetical protein
LLTLTVAIHAVLAPTHGLSAQAAATGSIGGVVLSDDSVTPLRARVWLVAAARPQPANARGTFGFEGLAKGRYHVRATYLGFVPIDTLVALAAGARVRLVLHMHSVPVELSSLTIRETIPHKEPPPKPTKPPIVCARVLIVSPRALLCMTPETLVRTTVRQNATFLGSNTRIVEAAQKTVDQLGFVIEQQRALDNQTWLIVAHERAHPADTGSAKIEVEETDAHDTTVRVTLTTVSWKKHEQRDRARAFLTTIDRNIQ